jgi:hypothetical protein
MTYSYRPPRHTPLPPSRRTNRKSLVLGAVVLGLLGVGCSTPKLYPPLSSTSSVAWPGSDSPGAPTAAQPTVAHEQIGQKVGLCAGGSTSLCDVSIAITSIQPGVQCDDEYEPIRADQQMLRFDIEIWTAPQFEQHDSQNALFLKNWGIGDAAGVDTNLMEHTVIHCGGGLTGDEIQQFLVPGTHMTKSIYVSAAKNATILRLYDDTRSGSGWVWDIPGSPPAP